MCLRGCLRATPLGEFQLHIVRPRSIMYSAAIHVISFLPPGMRVSRVLGAMRRTKMIIGFPYDRK